MGTPAPKPFVLPATHMLAGARIPAGSTEDGRIVPSEWDRDWEDEIRNDRRIT